MKKDKWLGHMVRIKKSVSDSGAGCRGEVVCVVRDGKLKQYIVQFPDHWCYYDSSEMKVEE